eukprot:CAMPEP_0197009418 /NCGR_PEP_ID=MMETSP1380-20130617/50022_1 /TAXON_ID=5936 /ORGANISM="Euplotes crassus, Strain CT5" /LENGTH=35 /DNA_ID= /DNA_START= /DNA_END= /DNA_ORIENTATION=
MPNQRRHKLPSRPSWGFRPSFKKDQVTEQQQERQR